MHVVWEKVKLLQGFTVVRRWRRIFIFNLL